MLARALFVLFAFGCSAPEQGRVEVRWLDRARFETQVEPVLAARCASTACHGKAERPFALYAPLRWRRDPARTLVDEPLSAEELDHDYVASCVFASDGRALLHKASEAHGGSGVIFADPGDPEHAALRAWVEAP